ncbi:ArsR/SmtB family transcription factor [Deinococcus sp. PESE-13]
MLNARVANAAQARLLLKVELRPMLNLLMQEPQSVSSLARTLGLNLQRASYLLEKLLKADIVEISGEQRRAGRPVKLYRLQQDWFIPFEMAPSETLETFVLAQVQPRLEELVRALVQVFMQRTGEQRGFWLSAGNLSLGDASGAAQQLWEGDEPLLFTLGQIRVSEDKARTFKRLLLELAEAEELSPTQKYAFAVLMVPTVKD